MEIWLLLCICRRGLVKERVIQRDIYIKCFPDSLLRYISFWTKTYWSLFISLTVILGFPSLPHNPCNIIFFVRSSIEAIVLYFYLADLHTRTLYSFTLNMEIPAMNEPGSKGSTGNMFPLPTSSFLPTTSFIYAYWTELWHFSKGKLI